MVMASLGLIMWVIVRSVTLFNNLALGYCLLEVVNIGLLINSMKKDNTDDSETTMFSIFSASIAFGLTAI